MKNLNCRCICTDKDWGLRLFRDWASILITKATLCHCSSSSCLDTNHGRVHKDSTIIYCWINCTPKSLLLAFCVPVMLFLSGFALSWGQSLLKLEVHKFCILCLSNLIILLPEFLCCALIVLDWQLSFFFNVFLCYLFSVIIRVRVVFIKTLTLKMTTAQVVKTSVSKSF